MNKQTTSSSVSRQAGFSHVIGLALVVLAFAAIGFIGYKLYAHPGGAAGGADSVNSQTKKTELDASSAPQITKSSDLDSAESVLNKVDTSSASSSDTSQLDSQLDSF
jgi:hypothetical protein